MIEKTKSYKYKVYEKIKEDIIIGKYSEGEVLNERRLSDLLGISRTPIREALQLLNVDGWVVQEPYRGSVVRTFKPDYVGNVLSVRRALEVLAVEEATKRLNDDQIKDLQYLLEEQRNSINNLSEEDFMKLDSKFHQKIHELSNNKITYDLLSNYRDIIRFYGIKSLKMDNRKKDTVEEHAHIIQAMIEKDIELAKKTMEFHMFMAEKVSYGYVSDLNK
jgi:DNA-binding GntR family transcriptional regulator